MMSIVKFNIIRSYWCSNIGNGLVAMTMSIYTFEDTRRFPHFNDVSKMKTRVDLGHDRLFRIQPFIENQLTAKKKVQL